MKKVHSSIHLVLSFIVTCTIITLWTPNTVQAQGVGIGTVTPDTSAILDLTSDTTGFLVPRMTLTQRDAINTPATGLLVFVTTDSMFHYFDGATWLPIDGRTRMLVDADGDTRIQVEETPDDDTIRFYNAGTEYFRMYNGRLFVLNTGNSVFLGDSAGISDNLGNNNNVFVGASAGRSNTGGIHNIAIGHEALYSNTGGDNNVAIGEQALYSTSGTGGQNVAIGRSAMKYNITGSQNVATGRNALLNNIDGKNNVATGHESLWEHISGDHNTAIGHRALSQDTTGEYNTAVGSTAMYRNLNSLNNSALGYEAMYDIETGNQNTGIGTRAAYSGSSGNNNSVLGYEALYTNVAGSRNVAIGTEAGYSSTGDSSIFIGNKAGYSETAGNRLYIENSDADSTNALIYGEFDNDLLRVNGRLIATMGLSDADGDTKIEMEQTPDDDTIRFNMAGTEFFRMANGRLEVMNTGSSVFMGRGAGMLDDLSDNKNIFIGDSTGANNTVGIQNTAVGQNALRFNTGNNNTAFGYRTLQNNTIGFQNAAIGNSSLKSNTTGGYNTALGDRPLFNNTTGSGNTAIGSASLLENITGDNNTVIGQQSLLNNTSGIGNTAIGRRSGYNNLGDYNVFLGINAGFQETGSNRLYIENSDADSTNALIYGEFDNDILAFNAKVGIGTTTPDYKLHVLGQSLIRDTSRATLMLQTSSNSKDMGLAFRRSGANYEWNIFREGSTSDLVFTGGNESDINALTEIIRMTSGGNVGIGTSLPEERLHVSGGNAIIDRGPATASLNRKLTIGGAKNTGNGAYATIQFNNYDSNDESIDYTGASIASTNATGNESGDLRFYTAETDSVAKERMIISPLGRVGIGTSSPSVSLNVANGDVRIDRGSETSNITRTLTINGAYSNGFSPFAQLNFENYDSNDGASNYIAASIQSENSNMQASGNLTFWTNPGGMALTQQMTITEEGAVGIGTTSPDTRFNVTDANISGAVATIENTTINSNGIGLIVVAGPPVNPSNQFVRFKDGDGTTVGSIAGNGAGGVVYNTTSDRRLKSNIRSFEHGMPLLMQIRPTIYERNSKPGVDEIGFIAQEMYEVYPQIVSGTPDQPVDNPMMVDYGRLTPVLVAAIQEQQHTIEQQQRMIEAYQMQINALSEAQSAQQAQLDTLSAMVKSMVETTASSDQK